MHLISTGFSCNNSCLFCAQGSLRTLSKEPLNYDVTAALEHHLGTEKSDRDIAFVGGEPTLRPELLDWVAYAKRLGARRVLVQTNGRGLIRAGLAKKLAAAGLDALDVSLHGSSAAMHDYHTAVPGSWLETLAGIRQARLAGIPIGITTVITRSNFRNLSEIVQLSAKNGASAVHPTQTIVLGQAFAARARLVPDKELVYPYLEAALDLARSLGLGFLSDDAAHPASAREFFAGVGETEALPQAADLTENSTPSIPKAKPGLNEVHKRDKKTGESLKTLFPHLFDPSTPGPVGGRPE